MQEGDVVIGLASTGIHSNGFSLVRKILKLQGLNMSSPCPWSTSYANLGHALLEPTALYVQQLLPVCKQGLIKGLSHITGGGFIENVPRMLPNDLGCEIDVTTWTLPEVFKWLKKAGNIEAGEMARTFNCGVGMVAVVSADNAEKVSALLKDGGTEVFRIGRLGGKSLQLKGLESW